ncbi:MAG: DUF6089 family protein [Cytophagaceae bacterium]
MKLLKPLSILIGLFFLFRILPANAQAHYELGAVAGVSKYFGDLNQQLFSPGTHSAWGLFFRYNVGNNFSLKSSIIYTRLSGDDSHRPYEENEINFKLRNLNFHTNLLEFSLVTETYILNRFERKFSPYIIAGAGIFHFDPRTEINGKTHRLRPLGTEGQGIYGYEDPYSLWAFCGIFGLGVNYQFSEKINMSLEASYRITTTNYIDDVGGFYPNRQALLNHHGALAVQLSDRSYQAAQDDPILMEYLISTYGGFSIDENGNTAIDGLTSEGSYRGTNRNDRYLMINLSISYVLKSRPDRTAN